MSHRILIVNSIIFLLLASNVHGQVMAYGEYSVDTTDLNLARTKKLIKVIRIKQDSGKIPDTTETKFSKRQNQIWVNEPVHNYIDTGTITMLFDSLNHFIFEADYKYNRFLSRGRISYYYRYDSLGRVIKKSELRTEENNISTSTVSYSENGDTVTTKDYSPEGILNEVQMDMRDKFGNLLFSRTHFPRFQPDTELDYPGNVYDSNGRMIEFTNFFSKKSPHISKYIYVDSPKVGIERTYFWSDSNWSSYPSKISRMDSNALILTESYFDSAGKVSQIDTLEYQSIKHPTREIRRNVEKNWIKTSEWHRDDNGNLILYEEKRDGHVIRTEKNIYIYSK